MPGTWQVTKNGKSYIKNITVNEKEGILSFEGTKGNYKFSRQSVATDKQIK